MLLVGSNHFRGILARPDPAVHDRRRRGASRAGESGTPKGPQPVDVPLARHVVRVPRRRRSSTWRSRPRLQIDHGQSHAIQYLWSDWTCRSCRSWSTSSRPPLPSLRRCVALGRALRRSRRRRSPAARRVVVVGSGGLSHRLPFPDWRAPQGDDEEFLVGAWLRRSRRAGRTSTSAAARDHPGRRGRAQRRVRPRVPARARGRARRASSPRATTTVAGAGGRQRRPRAADLAGHGGRGRRAPGRRWPTSRCPSGSPGWPSPSDRTRGAIDDDLDRPDGHRLPPCRTSTPAACPPAPCARAGDGSTSSSCTAPAATWRRSSATSAAHARPATAATPSTCSATATPASPTVPYEIPRYVEHLVAYLDAVGHRPRRTSSASRSAAGWPRWLASEHPERVRSLQLRGLGRHEGQPGGDGAASGRPPTRPCASDDIELTRKRLRPAHGTTPANVTDELVEVRHAIYHQPDFVANLHNLLCLQDMETRQRNLLRPDRLARISAPTLVVWGRQNPFGEVPEAEAIADAIARVPPGAARRVRALAPARAGRALQRAQPGVPRAE